MRSSMQILMMYFNPRSHERSDADRPAVVVSNNKFQSTLPREERPSRLRSSAVEQNFNPRSHERSDQAMAGLKKALQFQSTLPREERQITAKTAATAADFNPRSHERSDRGHRAGRGCIAISIHAPTRGATYNCHLLPDVWNISIHAPTRGATVKG